MRRIGTSLGWFARRPSRRIRRVFAAGCTGLILAASLGEIRAQGTRLYEKPPINYSHTQPQDAIARLVRRIAAKEVALQGSDQEIVRGVLRELGISPESQAVVFSRTSLQSGLIRPAHPRALYFSDSVYLGWVPGGLVEAVAIDPALGPVFYAFDPQDARDGRRSFVRETSCLRCHAGTRTDNLPGLLALSGATGADGEPLAEAQAELVDDRTAFERRWGGWYVTGYAGKPNHRGNAFAREVSGQIDFNPTDRRPMELSADFTTADYLAPTSDIVALMLLEHQVAMHNSLTRAAYRVRQAGDTAAAPIRTEDKEHVLAAAAEDVLDHLLFRDAAPLPDGIVGSAGFRQAFSADARRSRAGHSLKDLSVHGRLLANRCSYLIYSESFAALPAPLEDRVLDRLAAILQGRDSSDRYAYLEADEKHRILEVLTETQPEARRHFQSFPSSP